MAGTAPASSADPARPTSLTIAVLTFRRPRDLEAIVPLLVAQAGSVATDALDVDVLVVDNDPEGAAADQLARIVASLPDSRIAVRYENETVPGISAARNRALESSTSRDLLVFIDDDERPSDSWLGLLLDCMAANEATAVVGPVISEYERTPEQWITAGQFFKRRRLPTGTRVDVAATNNLLLDLRWVRAHDLRFDLDFGITGGDDTMFTRSLTRRGGSIVWCDEAIVFDIVPRARITRRWVVLRALSSGNSWSLTSVKLEDALAPRLAVRAQLTAQGGIRLAGGVARISYGFVLRRQDQRARGVRTLARGAGMVLGAYGYRYHEYKRT